MNKPKVSNSASQTEMEKIEKQLNEFDNQVKEMTLDRMNMAPEKNVEPQTKISQSEVDKSKDVYLKPARTINSREKFNETYREQYNFAKEYVQFVAENKEIIGETIEMWTKPFAGVPAEFWQVPVNKPVWGPRHLAEQISKCKYHRFSMEEKTISNDGLGQYYGKMVVDNTIQRLNAEPVSQRRSVFTGAKSF